MEENRVRLKMYRIASLKDTKRLADYIYFMMKQYPDCGFCKGYKQSLMYLKNKLIKDYGWDADEIEKLYVLLNELTKYKFFPIDKKI